MFAKSYIDFMPKLKDSFESIPLDEIEKLSHRLKSLIIRNKRKIKDLHDYAQIFGSLDIVRGLEYHFDNFLTHLNSLSAKSEIEDDTMLDHEAIAYLGRLGQLYYFARSIGKISGCPKIKELYLFRRKIVVTEVSITQRMNHYRSKSCILIVFKLGRLLDALLLMKIEKNVENLFLS